MNDKSQKTLFRQRYIIAGVIVLSIIAALVFIWFTQEPQSDPTSEKIIREAVALQLKKEPNDITDEDFGIIEVFSLPTIKNGSTVELYDIKFIEKFTNLNELSLYYLRYPEKAIPEWMKILAKLGIYDLNERFAIDLSPLEKLSHLQKLDLSFIQIKDIKTLANLTELEQLTLVAPQISDIEPIKNLINLQTLNIDYTQVSNLEPIKSLFNLKSLSLHECENITDEQIKDLQKTLPNLKIIGR